MVDFECHTKHKKSQCRMCVAMGLLLPDKSILCGERTHRSHKRMLSRCHKKYSLVNYFSRPVAVVPCDSIVEKTIRKLLPSPDVVSKQGSQTILGALRGDDADVALSAAEVPCHNVACFIV